MRLRWRSSTFITQWLNGGVCMCARAWAGRRSQGRDFSGHLGVPLEAMPGMIQRLQTLYQKTTGTAIVKKTGPKVTIGKKDKVKAKGPKATAAKKEKTAPPPKKSMEDLDNELMSYTAQRGADEGAPAEPIS